MIEGSDYQRTIAIMCRDFLDQVDEISELANENDLLDRITDVIIENGDDELFHIRNLQDHLYKYELKLLSLYSKNPQNSRLDALYRKAECLKEMCANLTEKN